jgi:hypothetical protein
MVVGQLGLVTPVRQVRLHHIARLNEALTDHKQTIFWSRYGGQWQLPSVNDR